MSRYDGGADLERAAKKVLEDSGYYVIRSAGSKGVADLAALKRGEVLLVQCKTDGRIDPAGRVALRTVAIPLGATCLVARWYKPGRAARTVAFDELTSMGPAGFRSWTPNHGLERHDGTRV